MIRKLNLSRDIEATLQGARTMIHSQYTYISEIHGEDDDLPRGTTVELHIWDDKVLTPERCYLTKDGTCIEFTVKGGLPDSADQAVEMWLTDENITVLTKLLMRARRLYRARLAAGVDESDFEETEPFRAWRRRVMAESYNQKEATEEGS